ncbi:MAG: MnhB domain-containing protein [Candidatus Methanospirareceae archaeon]
MGSEEVKGREENEVEEDVIVKTISRIMIPFIQLFALYVMIGTEGAGGGFQGGVIFASSCILFVVAFGIKRSRGAISERWSTILSSFGLFIYAGIGILCILLSLGVAEYLNYGALPIPIDVAYLRGYIISFGIEVGIGITVAMVFTSLFFDLAWKEKA